jgi:hypothetical protein
VSFAKNIKAPSELFLDVKRQKNMMGVVRKKSKHIKRNTWGGFQRLTLFENPILQAENKLTIRSQS